MEDKVTLRRSTRHSVINKTEELTPVKKKVSTPVKVEPSTPSRRTRASSSTPKKSLIERISTPKKTLSVLNEEETPQKRNTSNIKSISSTLTPKKKRKGESPVKDESTKTSTKNDSALENTDGLKKENISSSQNKTTNDEIKNSASSGKILTNADRPLTRAKRKTLTEKQAIEVNNVSDEKEKSPHLKKGNVVLKSDVFCNTISDPSEKKSDSVCDTLSSSALVPRIIINDLAKCGIKEANKAEGLGKNIDYDIGKVSDIFTSRSPTKAGDIVKISENHENASEASVTLNINENFNEVRNDSNNDGEVLNISVDQKRRISMNEGDHNKFDHVSPKGSSNNEIVLSISPEKCNTNEFILVKNSLDSRTDSPGKNETERSFSKIQSLEKFECESSHNNVTETDKDPNVSHIHLEYNTVKSESSFEEQERIENNITISSEDIFDPNKRLLNVDSVVSESSSEIAGSPSESITNNIISIQANNIALTNICVSTEAIELKAHKTIKEESVTLEDICSNKETLTMDSEVIIDEVSILKSNKADNDFHENSKIISDNQKNDNNVSCLNNEDDQVAREESEELFRSCKEISSVVLTTSGHENIASELEEFSCIKSVENVNNLKVERISTNETSTVMEVSGENNLYNQSIEVATKNEIPEQSAITDEKIKIIEVDESQEKNAKQKIESKENLDIISENDHASPNLGDFNDKNMDIIEGDENDLVKENFEQINKEVNSKNISINDGENKTPNELDTNLTSINEETHIAINNKKNPKRSLLFKEELKTSMEEGDEPNETSENSCPFNYTIPVPEDCSKIDTAIKKIDGDDEAILLNDENDIKIKDKRSEQEEHLDIQSCVNVSFERFEDAKTVKNLVDEAQSNEILISYVCSNIAGTHEMSIMKQKTQADEGPGVAFLDLKTTADDEEISGTLNVPKSPNMNIDLPVKTDDLDDIMSPKDFLKSDEEFAVDCEKLDGDKNITDDGSSTVTELEIENNYSEKNTKQEIGNVNSNNVYDNDNKIETAEVHSSFENNSLHDNMQFNVNDSFKESAVIVNLVNLSENSNNSKKSFNSMPIKRETSDVSNDISPSDHEISNHSQSGSLELLNYKNEFSNGRPISISFQSSKNIDNVTINDIKTETLRDDKKNVNVEPITNEEITLNLKENDLPHECESSIEDISKQTNSNYNTTDESPITDESIKGDNLNKKRLFKNSPLKPDKLKDLFENYKDACDTDSKEISGKDFIEFEAEVGEESDEVSEELSSSSDVSGSLNFFSLEAKENNKKRSLKTEDSDSSDHLESVSILFQSPKNLIIDTETSQLSLKNKKQKIEHSDFSKRHQKTKPTDTKKVDSQKVNLVNKSKNLALEECTNAGVFAVSNSSQQIKNLEKAGVIFSSAGDFNVSKIDLKRSVDAAPRGFVVTQIKPDPVKEKLATLKRTNHRINQKKSILKSNRNKSMKNVLKPKEYEGVCSAFSVSLILPTSCTTKCIQTVLKETGIRNVSSIYLIKPKVAVVEFSDAESHKKVVGLYGELTINDKPIYILDNSPCT